MILKKWLLMWAVEFIFTCISSQSTSWKRRCAFQVNPKNKRYKTFGNVSGSIQFCDKTQCCVGYYIINNEELKIDVLACDSAEKYCPYEACEGQTRLGSRVIKCVCNTDLCNSNMTWNQETRLPEPAYSFSEDAIVMTAAILAGSFTVLVLCLVISKRRNLLKEKKENPPSHDEYAVPQLHSCPTTKSSEIDAASIELQKVMSFGKFATVWQGRYQGCAVAVKVFPAGWKHLYTAEKEVFELPLMKHAGIVHFLGTGRKTDGSSWLIVLQMAECGSLHSFLHENTTTWTSSLKLCQSLSWGLSYLHSDLRRYDVRKPPVAHRDLSSSNVLVRADGTCVLCDFGYSTILYSFPRLHMQSYTTAVAGHTQCGTLRYMAPEILEGSVNLKNTSFLMQGDIYALALLQWEIWLRCSDLHEGRLVPQHLLPYESELGANVTMETLIVYVCEKGERPSIPQHWKRSPQGSAVQEILTECWDCDPDARLSAQCVMERLTLLQSYYSLPVEHLHPSLYVTTV